MEKIDELEIKNMVTEGFETKLKLKMQELKRNKELKNNYRKLMVRMFENYFTKVESPVKKAA